MRGVAKRTLSLLIVTVSVGVAVSAQGSIPHEKLFKAIGARQGSIVCEIGAGDGELTIKVAGIVGPDGHVYASELGESHLKKLRERVAASGLQQITVVASESTTTNFPNEACDGVFMRDVYHHFSDPASMNLSIFAALKPDGRVAIVDFTPPGQEASRPADRGKDGMHGVQAETVSREVKEAGFDIASSESSHARWFVVVAVKPARQGSDDL